MIEQCQYETERPMHSPYLAPAEQCDNDAEPDCEFCHEHRHLLDGPDPDDERDRALDAGWLP